MKKLKVGGRYYSVITEHDNSEQDEVFKRNPDVYGFIDYATSEIKIKNGLPSDHIAENIVHEILHALFENIGYSEANIEQTIKFLTPRLHSFLIDNPNFQKDLLLISKDKP